MELVMGRNYIKLGFCYIDIHSHPSDNKNIFNKLPIGKQSNKSSRNGTWKNHGE